MFRCDLCQDELEWNVLYRDVDGLFPGIVVCVECQPLLLAQWRATSINAEKHISSYQVEAKREHITSTLDASPRLQRHVSAPSLQNVHQDDEPYPFISIDELTSYYHRWRHPDEAHMWLRKLHQSDYVILDTETTGSRRYSQVIEIAVLSKQGNVLFHSLLQPSTSIEPISTSVHGLTWKDVKGAPTFDQISSNLYQCLQDKLVLAYNAAFDIRLLFQTARAFEIPFPRPEATCMMYCYSKVRSEMTAYGQYRRFPLGDACQHMQIAVPTTQLGGERFILLDHRAEGDARHLLELVQCLTEQATKRETL